MDTQPANHIYTRERNWDYHQKNERVSRAECVTMNALAECLAMGNSAE